MFERFEWSPRTARRILALEAVQVCISSQKCTPIGGTSQVIASHVAGDRPEGPTSLSLWLSELGSGARAFVHAEAAAWATQLLLALDWAQFEKQPLIHVDRRCSLASGRVVLRARIDVATRTRSATQGHRPIAFFSMLGGRPGPAARIELGLSALAWTLSAPHRVPPARVVGFWPQCGRAMIVSVDEELLQDCSNAVIKYVDASWGTAPRV